MGKLGSTSKSHRDRQGKVGTATGTSAKRVKSSRVPKPDKVAKSSNKIKGERNGTSTVGRGTLVGTSTEEVARVEKGGKRKKAVEASTSIAHVIRQALVTKDRVLFDSITATTDRPTVKHSIADLTASEAEALVRELLLRIEASPGRYRQVSYWLETALACHMPSLLLSQEVTKSLVRFNDLLEQRLRCHNVLVRTKGLLEGSVSVASKKIEVDEVPSRTRHAYPMSHTPPHVPTPVMSHLLVDIETPLIVHRVGRREATLDDIKAAARVSDDEDDEGEEEDDDDDDSIDLSDFDDL